MDVNTNDDDYNNLPEFFNVYIHRLTFNRMLIPREFVRCMERRNNSGLAELVGPSGRTSRVEMVKDGEDFYFVDGWRAFVEQNLVGEGNFMFFKYHGDLKFSVVIYDETMCEKSMELNDEESIDGDGVIEIGDKENEVTTATRSHEKHFQLEVDKTEDQTAISIKPSFLKRVLGSYINIPKSFLVDNCLSYKSNEKMVLRTSGNLFWEVNIIKGYGKITLCGGWSTFARENCIRVGDICRFELLDRLEMMVNVANQEEGVREKKVNVVTSVINSLKRSAEISQPSDSPPSTTAGQAVTERIMPSSNKPSFTVVMKNYNVVKHFLVQIPGWFVKENSLQYMENKSVILRNDKDSSWSVKVDKYRLSRGWAAFVHSNDVKAGDTCKFELVKKLEMKVHILTATSEND